VTGLRVSLPVTVTEELYADGTEVHADGAADLAPEIDDAGTLGNQRRWQQREAAGGHRRHDQTQPDPAQRGPGHQPDGGGGLVGGAHHHHAGDEERQATGDHPRQGDAVGEVADKREDERHGEAGGHQHQAGAGGAEPGHLLEVQRHHIGGTEHAGAHHDGQQEATGEPGRAEHSQIKQRIRTAPLPEREQAQQQGPAEQGGEQQRFQPAAPHAGRERPKRRHQTQAEQHQPAPVQARRLFLSVVLVRGRPFRTADIVTKAQELIG